MLESQFTTHLFSFQSPRENKKKRVQIQNTFKKQKETLMTLFFDFMVKNIAKCSFRALISYHLSKHFSYIYLSRRLELGQYTLENKQKNA